MPKIYSPEFKLSVINFYNSDLFTIENTKAIFGISKSSLYNWINLYKQNLLHNAPNIRHFYKSKITCDISNYIVIYVTKRIHFTMKNLRRCIFRIFSVHVSKSGIYNVLKSNNITNKKISQKINPKYINNTVKVNELLKNVSTYSPNKIISIDESSFDTHMRPLFGWSKKGTNIRQSISIPKRQRKTLTLAVSNNKIIGYSLVNGSSNKFIFENFLKEQVLSKVKNSILLMDNVSFHHSKSVVECVNSSSNKILYNVAYNPETNPIEFVFSIIKNFVRKHEPVNVKDLKKSIINSFKLVTSTKLKNIFKHSLNI